MPDSTFTFGTSGKITVRNDRNKESVIVNIKEGEYLYFRVKVQGGVPTFTFSCQHDDFVASQKQFFPNHPTQLYEWKWGKNGAGFHDVDEDSHLFRMLFTASLKYSLLVEHRDANDNVIKILKDMDFESKTNSDDFAEVLVIFVPLN